jgi:TolB protein
MLPANSTGPMAPAWGPDGRIAFAAQGDIWVVPASGGTAVALTEGPSYYFEPAWSPHGRRIACSTIDPQGRLGIAILTVGTGAVQSLNTGPGVAVEPAWSGDGRSLYYVNLWSGHARGMPFLYRRDLASGVNTPVAPGFEPAVSPDGTELAYVAPVRGKIGTGGLWVRPIGNSSAAPRLVRYEQTEYRMKPAWTRDGKRLLFVSDRTAYNMVELLSVNGGSPVPLTPDAPHDAYGPSVSPGGSRFAFVSNRTGATTLYTAPLGGGPLSSWHRVTIRAWKARRPTGEVRIRVLDAAGQPVAANVFLTAADGRFYAPAGAFARQAESSGVHFFATSGSDTVTVPAGTVTVEAMKGYEYRPASAKVTVAADGTTAVMLRLERLENLPAEGWYSGDTHIHDLHQGMFGLTHRGLVQQLQASDLHITFDLIHMDGTRLMGRWGDLTGRPSPLSTPNYILQYAEEFRGSLGHMELIGIHHFITPLIAGAFGTADAQPTLDYQYIDAAHAQGGMAGFPHPYYSVPTTPALAHPEFDLKPAAHGFYAAPTTPENAGQNLIATDVALGRGDYYEVASMASEELASTGFYYKLLNCGFHLAAVGGTDNFGNAALDTWPGSDRTYVHVQGPLTVRNWLAGLKAGHTVASTAPLLSLSVGGREPGDTIRLSAGAPATLRVQADARSIAPMERLEIIVNGQVAANAVAHVAASDPHHLRFDGEVAVPQGGWVAARVIGPPSRYVGDSYSFAQTSPVYVVRNGRPWVSAADAVFLAQSVENLWQREAHAPWRSPQERHKFHSALERARAVYERIAAAGDHH